MRYYCNVCKKTISKEVYAFSMKHYKKSLCMTHQKQAKTSYSNKIKYKSYTPKTYKKSKVTPQARELYNALKKRGIKCRLEAYDGYKHVDISIEWARVNIEIDGKHHIYNAKQAYADMKRTEGSQEDDIYTMRIPNSHIEEDVDKVANTIAKVVRRRHREDEFW